MKLTLIHPCVGRRLDQHYLRTWQMAPLSPAVVAGLTPREVEVRFYDDSLEPIPYDEPADLVAMTVETYTARRAYQIASEFRRRNVPVVMGGFHASLNPEEVSQYAEAVVIGEAEGTWERVLSDAERGSLAACYVSPARPSLAGLRPDRSIYGRRRYLPLGLVETGRGCPFGCEFCSVQTFHQRTFRRRPAADVLAELETMPRRPLIFFVDDNIAAGMAEARDLFGALAALRIQWVTQASIAMAYDEEFLGLLAASGCRGVLIGFESLNPANLKDMNKAFNAVPGGFEKALANLRRHNIRIYATFIFGYDEDTQASFAETVRFALDRRFYLAAFNHLVPFPGTPLYRRLEGEGRLLRERWWLDETYGFNQVAFRPLNMTAEQLEQGCLSARRVFYSPGNIWRRGLDPGNRSDPKLAGAFYAINALFNREVGQRHHLPLGDQAWKGEMIKVRERGVPPPGSRPGL